MAGIYIHIPFCRQACHYCDFHFSTDQSVEREMTSSISKELLLQRNYLDGEEIDTIYFGGGTPSVIPSSSLNMILDTIHKNFKIHSDPEITLEANPEDLSREKLQDLKSFSINRLSIGVQSFDDVILSYLNRSHDAATSLKSFANARDAGFKNISVDLIYAIKGLDDAGWQRSIDRALSIAPDHISSYSLTIEPSTVFGNWLKKGKIPPVDDDVSAGQLTALVRELTAAGYDQYEVSNFGKPGFYSRHNSSYWQRMKYLGAGPGAHSYNGESRQYNVRNNHLYIKSIGSGKVPFEFEKLSVNDKVNDYLLTTLRTMWGTDFKFIKDNFHVDLFEPNQTYIRQLVENGLAVVKDNVIKLTPGGLFVADKISSDLFLSDD